MLRHQEGNTEQTSQFEGCSKSFEGQSAQLSENERAVQDAVKSDQGATLVQVEIVASQSDES